MRISNPFQIFHEFTLRVVTRATWSLQHNRDLSPPYLAFISMTIGITIIISGVLLIDIVLAWFVGAVIGLPFLVRKDIKKKYHMNTAHGHKNKAQLEWPFLTGLHCFCLCIIAISTQVPGIEGWAALMMTLGVYVMLVLTLYILITDPLPPSYRPTKKHTACA